MIFPNGLDHNTTEWSRPQPPRYPSSMSGERPGDSQRAKPGLNWHPVTAAANDTARRPLDARRDDPQLRGRVQRDGQGAERLRGGGPRHHLRARGVQLRRGQPARLHRRPHDDAGDRLRHPADLLKDPGPDRDDRGRPGLRVRRAVHPRPRHLGPAGDRGLARRPLRRPDRPDQGADRDLPGRLAARAARLPGQALHAPAPGRPGHRPRQAAQADQPPGPRPHPDRHRRPRPQERRARGRAGRGLAAHLLPPGEGRHRLGRAAQGGAGQARPTTCRRWT